MGTKHEDANLILKLYELRREALMRQARNWFALQFHPTSAESIVAVLKGEHSAFFRMVTSYWEMAAGLVNQGGIDAEMFRETNGEHLFVFAKLEPFLEGLRKDYGNPRMLVNLEKLVRATPNAEQTLKAMRERMAAMAAPSR